MRFQSSFLLAALVASLAGGCVAEGDTPPPVSLSPPSGSSAAPAGLSAPVAFSSPSETQPRQATYRCDGNRTLTVENMRSSVQLIDPQGDTISLPASPASQQSRYGQPGYALVLEGRDALYMKGGKPPVTCRR